MMTKKQKDPFRVGAKDIGALNMPDSCPRCFWIKQRCKPLPFQIFPGIFSTIDAYTRKIVHASFDQFGKPPTWLPELSKATRYLKVPHWSKFVRKDEKTGITSSGVMDDLFENVNGSLTIPDYKTAKFTATQDKLYPMYAGQLNTYAWIQQALSDRPIGSLWLIYFEPVTASPGDKNVLRVPPWPLEKYSDTGFDMGFSAHCLQVEHDPEMVPRLLSKAKGILQLAEPPTGLQDCKDCSSLSNLHEMLGMF